MPRSSHPSPSRSVSVARPLRLGFIALTDAAPLVVAHELGIFKQHGLNVTLQRELGWATIRDKIAFGELDAAHAISSLLISTRLGLDSPPVEVLTACVLSSGGNAITLSQRLGERGVRDAASLRDEITATRHERLLVLGVAAAHSTHYLHLSTWLRSADINPRRDVRIVVVPPAQVFRNLEAGTIDGYCVGDPWNSLAVQKKIGWCPVIGDELHPGLPEKVLMVKSDFARERHEEHLQLVAALVAAGRQCDNPSFHPALAKLLARREYLNLPSRVIAAGLGTAFDPGQGNSPPSAPFVRFSGETNVPSQANADRLVSAFVQHERLPPARRIPAQLSREIFRTDLFTQAQRRFGTET